MPSRPCLAAHVLSMATGIPLALIERGGRVTPRRCLCSHIRSLHPGDGKCRIHLRADVTSTGWTIGAASRNRESAATEKEREPLWAAAAQAYAEGTTKPLPRPPTVRPESDYVMRLPGDEPEGVA